MNKEAIQNKTFRDQKADQKPPCYQPKQWTLLPEYLTAIHIAQCTANTQYRKKLTAFADSWDIDTNTSNLIHPFRSIQSVHCDFVDTIRLVAGCEYSHTKFWNCIRGGIIGLLRSAPKYVSQKCRRQQIKNFQISITNFVVQDLQSHCYGWTSYSVMDELLNYEWTNNFQQLALRWNHRQHSSWAMSIGIPYISMNHFWLSTIVHERGHGLRVEP